MTETIADGALAVHHTATVDEPWDGPAAVAAMPNDSAVLRYCHAWQSADGKPDAKGSFRMPHHETDGGPANLAACRNALARLPGADIPAAEKPGVERHLKAHLSDGGSDADNHDHSHLTNGPAMTQPQLREWFSIRNADDGPAQVYLYDEIGGGGWFSSGITAKDFVTALVAIKNSAIDLHINSPGGDVFDAIAIYNALRRHPATVTSYIDGLAASAASFIAQAGNKVVIERTAQFMVHDASGLCWGNAADMAKMVDLLNKASDNIADIYSQRSGVDATTWRAVMREEAWYSSAEAVIAGLADEVAPEPVTTDDRLTSTSRFAPVLKAMGARYRSRAEAPDPALIPAASVRAQRNGEPLRPAASSPVLPTPPAGTALTAAHVVMAPAPAIVPQQPSPAADPDHDALVALGWTPPVPLADESDPVPIRIGMRPAPVEDAPPEPFDAETFRAAIRAAVAR